MATYRSCTMCKAAKPRSEFRLNSWICEECSNSKDQAPTSGSGLGHHFLQDLAHKSPGALRMCIVCGKARSLSDFDLQAWACRDCNQKVHTPELVAAVLSTHEVPATSAATPVAAPALQNQGPEEVHAPELVAAVLSTHEVPATSAATPVAAPALQNQGPEEVHAPELVAAVLSTHEVPATSAATPVAAPALQNQGPEALEIKLSSALLGAAATSTSPSISPRSARSRSPISPLVGGRVGGKTFGNDLLSEFLLSPAPTPSKDERHAFSIGAKYNISKDIVYGPDGPGKILQLLGLEKLYSFDRPGEVRYTVCVDDVYTAYIGLLIYLAMSVVVDQGRPEGVLFREHLRLKETRGPMRVYPRGNHYGGFIWLLFSHIEDPLAERFAEFVIPWAQRQEDIIAQHLQYQVQALARYHPVGMNALKAVHGPRLQKIEGSFHLERYGTKLPALSDEESILDLAWWIEVIAEAVNSKFQQLVAKALSPFEQKQPGSVTQDILPVKSAQRIKDDWLCAHTGLERTHPGDTVDACSCRVVTDADHAAAVWEAIANEVCQNGGELVNVRNDFLLPDEDLAGVAGYRALVTNYRIQCPALSYADIIIALKNLLTDTELVTFVANRIVSAVEQFAEDTSPVQLLVESQITLPLFVESSKLSRWPSRITRCQDAVNPLDAFVTDLVDNTVEASDI